MAGFWQLVLPQQGVNLFQNPSYERGTAGAAGTNSGTINRMAGTAQYGAWALWGTPTSNTRSGVVAGTVTMGAGTQYVVNVSVFGAVGSFYQLSINPGAGGVAVTTTTFQTGGTWGRYSLSYIEASDTNRQIVISKDAVANTSPFAIDGVQVQAIGVQSVTTYLDGDQDGCTWLGQPHASQSLRSGTSRAGGTVVNLSAYGLTVLEMGGVGMPPVANITQEYAIADGALFQRQRAQTRVFTLTGLMSGTTWQGLHAIRSAVVDAVKIDRTPSQQPIRFLYSGQGGTSTVDAYYDGGMTMDGREGFTETAALRFVAPDPYWYAMADDGTALSPQAALGSMNFIGYRDPVGRWGTFGVAGAALSGVNALGVRTILPITGGTILVGGDFTAAGGTRASGVAYIQPGGAFGTLTGGTIHISAGTPIVNTAIQAPSGTIYIGGFFDRNVGGTVAKQAALYAGGAWGTLPGGTVDGNEVSRLTITPGGTLLASGSFTSVAGTRGTAIAMHNGVNWGTLAGGGIAFASPTQPEAIAGPDGRVYFLAAGAGGTSAGPGLYTWNGATFGTTAGSVALAGGGELLTTLQRGLDGRFTVGGWYTTYAGGTVNSITAYNGAQSQAFGRGVELAPPSGSAGIVFVSAVGSTGRVVAGGTFTSAGGVVVPDSVAEWTGAAWVSSDVQFPPQALANNRKINAIAWDGGGTLYVGGNFAGTATAAAVTAIVNDGAANVYPVAVLRNTGAAAARLFQLLNTTTGDGIWFNTSILPGETLTVDLRNGEKTVTSDFRGNLLGAVLPGSNLTTWRLSPGTNTVSFFANSGSVEATLYWRNRAWSADPRL